MRARRLSVVVVASVVATLVAPLAADAAPTVPPAPARAEAERGDPRSGHRSTGRLQVRFKDGTTAKGRDAALARVRAAGREARVVRTAPGLDAALLRVDDPRAVQALLREDPAVAYAEAESTYRPLAITPDTQTNERVAANLPTDTARGNETAPTGAGTEIAVIDSPVDPLNTDLAGRVVHSQDLAGDPVGDDDPTDLWDVDDFDCDPERCPHGTGVAAVAAAADGNGHVVGAAPGANVSSFNVFRRVLYTDQETFEQFEDLSASSLDIAEAIDAVRQRAIGNTSLVAVNMSLGGVFDNQLVKDALADLRADAPHVTVVVAAGNDGGERAQFPAGDPGVLSVGASGDESSSGCTFSGGTTVWTWSNRGDVDVVAPGACVLTWYRNPTSGPNAIPGQYAGSAVKRRVDGTSFASPMVAGVVALLGAAGVRGDAARAAILAGATPPGSPNVATGVGFLHAANALAVATGSSPYTAVFVDRGGQVANQVGRRTVEVLQVQPGVDALPPAQATPALPAGRGTLSGAASGIFAGTRRTTYLYTPPASNVGTVSFAMTAGSLAVPMRLLDPTNNFEGLPVPSGDQSTVALTYGSRSAYVRSASVGGGNPLRLDYTYGDAGLAWADPDVGPSSDLAIWQPLTAGGTADAAMEPFRWAKGTEYTGAMTVTAPRSGKYLFGWVLFSREDDSDPSDPVSRYRLKPTFGPSVALNAPGVASSVSATGPFRVSWTGSRATKYEIQWTTKVKSSAGAWVYGTWRTWTTTTTATGYTFGQNNKPVAVVKGQTYWFRIRAFDSVNNATPYVYKGTAVPQDNLSTSFSYAGSWSKRALGGRWFGWVHQSAGRGASLSHRAETSQFAVVGDKCASCGQFRVYVDGVLKATVDTRASSSLARQVLWTSASLGSPRAHTIKIVVLATPGRPWVVIDGIGTVR